jgi:ferredoxin
MLMQEHPKTGDKRPIGWASRQLLKHECHYSAFLLELQAAVYGIEHWATYLTRKPFVLYTDYRPMEKLSTVHTKTLNRLQEKMGEFHFKIRYISGQENTVTDYLSRSAGIECVSVDETETPESWRALQSSDPETGRWLAALEGDHSMPPHLMGAHFPFMEMWWRMLHIGLPRRKGFQNSSRLRVVVPSTMRDRLIQEGPNSQIAGHMGLFKTSEHIKERYWWPNTDAEIEHHVSRCQVCQASSRKGVLPKAPQLPLPESRRPNERVHIDLYGPVQCGACANADVIDSTSGIYLCVYRLRDAS